MIALEIIKINNLEIPQTIDTHIFVNLRLLIVQRALLLVDFLNLEDEVKTECLD